MHVKNKGRVCGFESQLRAVINCSWPTLKYQFDYFIRLIFLANLENFLRSARLTGIKGLIFSNS